jgi:hypothetical protein
MTEKTANYELHKTEKIIIKWGGMVWIDVAQERNQWMTFVKTVLNTGIYEI